MSWRLYVLDRILAPSAVPMCFRMTAEHISMRAGAVRRSRRSGGNSRLCYSIEAKVGPSQSDN